MDDIFGFLQSEQQDDFADAIEGEGDPGLSLDVLGGPSKDAVLFCVDCSQLGRITDAGAASESLLDRVLKSLYAFMRNKVIASDGSDMTGLVLYNVSKTNNPLRQKSINLVQPLGMLTAKRIQDIAQLVSSSYVDLTSQFGEPTSDTDISELLFVCNAQFKKTSAAYRPRMFIFTQNDDPCGSDRRARKAAITRANDFREGMSTGAEINLIPLVDLEDDTGGAESVFDVTKFWDNIVLVSSGSEEELGDDSVAKYRFVSEAVMQLSDMKEISLRKLFKKRPINRLNLYLDDTKETKIAFMMYTSYLTTSKPRHIYVDPETHVPLKVDSKFVSEYSGAVVGMDGGISTYVDFRGKQVTMTKEDISEIRNMGIGPSASDSARGITGSLELVGFKTSRFLVPQNCLTHSCFLYPQDDRVKGSSALVSAMVDRMHARDLVLIARAVVKSNSTVQFVALIPQPELVDPTSGRQERSPGFYLVRLPYADDVRDLILPMTNIAETLSASPEQNAVRLGQVERAKRVVDSMTEPVWEPEMLDNPSLKLCYSTLESLALGGSDSVQVEDLLYPDSAKVELAETEPVLEWLASLNMTDTVPCSLMIGPSGYKRPRPDGAEEGEEKVWTESVVKGLLTNGGIDRLLLNDLKKIFRDLEMLRNVSAQGKKADLIDRIRKYLQD